jgi:hypothetical protein
VEVQAFLALIVVVFGLLLALAAAMMECSRAPGTDYPQFLGYWRMCFGLAW